MASAFGSYAQRSIRPAAAITAGAVSVSLFSSSSRTQRECEESCQNNNYDVTKSANTSSPLFHGLSMSRNISSPLSWHVNSPFSWRYRNSATTLCEAAPKPAAYKPSDPAEPIADASNKEDSATKPKSGIWGEEDDGLYHGLFPRRQLWRPHLEYPLWHADWDGRQPKRVESEDKDESARLTAQRDRQIRKNGVTRHIILIRHGQYDETHKVCSM